MAHPVSPRLTCIWRRRPAEGIAAVQGGTYVCMEGPQFSSLAESLTYKAQGYSVIGMTNMPEAKLAREAEICYASVAMVTDFDCWHPDHDAVTVQDIIRVLNSNAGKAKALVARLARDFCASMNPVQLDRTRRSIPPGSPRRKRAACWRMVSRMPAAPASHTRVQEPSANRCPVTAARCAATAAGAVTKTVATSPARRAAS